MPDYHRLNHGHVDVVEAANQTKSGYLQLKRVCLSISRRKSLFYDLDNVWCLQG